jgi:hypothetical protein
MPIFRREPAPGERTRATDRTDREAAAFRRGRSGSARAAEAHANPRKSPFKAARRQGGGRGRGRA